MSWRLSPRVNLENPRISTADARRQMRTAAAVLERLDSQPGVILADGVGMGKTYVALAVAVSVVEATGGRRPVVVKVPPSVQDKWPRDWDVFRKFCLADGSTIRTTEGTLNDATSFLKVLDDPEARRPHIVFLTHTALTGSLSDPFVRLAIVGRALLAPSLVHQKAAFPRWAGSIIDRRFRDERIARLLLSKSPAFWRELYEKETQQPLEDEPVPDSLIRVLDEIDLSNLVRALERVPLRSSKNVEDHLQEVRRQVRASLRELWKVAVRHVKFSLPLLIIDEAHHLKNPDTRLASVLANPDSEDPSDEEIQKGPLGGVFDRMLFLTATPFQLGHHELVEILRRFEGVRWSDGLDRKLYCKQLEDLELRLMNAQAAALRLERSWGHLRPEDLPPVGDWWGDPGAEGLSEKARSVAGQLRDVRERLGKAEETLRPWVIRNVRPNFSQRRRVLCGRAIRSDDPRDGNGLEVTGEAVLPFLLAARAQSLVAPDGQKRHSALRAFFTEGLASSFEAYRETRSKQVTEFADELEEASSTEVPTEVRWYLDQVDIALPEHEQDAWSVHPKIDATVMRALELWRRGEKLVIFCFYRATCRSLRRHLSRALERELIARGAQQLRIDPADEDTVKRELERRAERFFDPDSPATAAAKEGITGILTGCDLAGEVLERAVAVTLRFVRTVSFQVRYLNLGNPDFAAAVREALDASHSESLPLQRQIEQFGQFLASRVESERAELLDALDAIQTGTIFVRKDDFGDDEEETGRGSLLPNVRMVNGLTKRDLRRRLMLAFNSPFFPEILIASSVMAEGIDLHLHCRHVIHHDLDWNPSVLEQRTGRLDRLGSKAEVVRRPVVVYEPFLEATQDEKLFRVVKDRERWFSVVMGDEGQRDDRVAEGANERVPLPREIAETLAMKLDLG